MATPIAFALHLHCICIAAPHRRSPQLRTGRICRRCMWPTTGLRGCGATGYAVCVHTISVIFNRPVTIKSDDPAGRTPYGGRPTLSPGSPHRAPAKNGLRGVRPPKRRSLRHLNAASPQRVTRIQSSVTCVPSAGNTNATIRNTHPRYKRRSCQSATTPATYWCVNSTRSKSKVVAKSPLDTLFENQPADTKRVLAQFKSARREKQREDFRLRNTGSNS